jgi:hypothetical protein
MLAEANASQIQGECEMIRRRLDGSLATHLRWSIHAARHTLLTQATGHNSKLCDFTEQEFEFATFDRLGIIQ